jgi:hypothetical protein
MRRKFNNFTEEKDELVKDFFYDNLNQIYRISPANNTKISVGDVNTKIGR